MREAVGSSSAVRGVSRPKAHEAGFPRTGGPLFRQATVFLAGRWAVAGLLAVFLTAGLPGLALATKDKPAATPTAAAPAKAKPFYEAEAAAWIQENMTKPVVAYIAGLTAPKGRTMGHAGAIISAFGESASEKVEILSAAGVTVAENPSVIGETIARVLNAA